MTEADPFDQDGWLGEHDPVLDAKFDYAFACFDQDGGGTLNEADFLVLAEKIRTRQDWPEADPRYQALRTSLLEFWEMMAICVDVDGSGTVDRQEFTLFERIMAEQVSEFGGQAPPWALDFVVALFQAVDADGDGSIQLEEYTLFLEVMGSTMDPAAAFARLDLDGSGSIEASELEELLVQYFTSTTAEDPGNYLLTGGWPQPSQG